MSLRPAGRLRLHDAALREAVLTRIVGALAAHADLSVDRLSDAQLASAALVSAAGRRAPDASLEIELAVGPGELELCIGPLPPGTAAAVVADTALPGVGAVLERLVDDWAVEARNGSAEVLRLHIGAGSAAAR